MPAIQPAKLKIQVSLVVEKFNQPGEFISALRDFFDFYSDRTRKPGRGSHNISVIPSYNIAKQVFKQLEVSLKPLIVETPQDALKLTDLLWMENYLEFKVLALEILGWIPADQPERIVLRVRTWVRESGNDPVLDAAFARCLKNLLKGNQDFLYEILEDWFNDHNQKSHVIGLRVLAPLLTDTEFKNIPRIFRYLTPLVHQIDKVPSSELIRVFRILAQRFPQETAFFVQRNLALKESDGIKVLIRQCLSAFPVNEQEKLKKFLHQMWERNIEHQSKI